jgi:hypothetical protein
VFLWFVAGSGIVVHQVFRSQGVDYRMVAAGSVLPLLDAVSGGPALLHTLLAPIVALVVVMLATHGRRLRRRQWLGVPIGMFLHLVLDGTWTRSDQLWWPAFGTRFDEGSLLEWSRGWVGVIMELMALAALVAVYRRLHLADSAVRARFLRTGRLPHTAVD